MGLPVAASSKAAVAFPQEVAGLIVVEDNAAALADKLAVMIQAGPRPPVARIREGLQRVYGASSLKNQLEDILAQATSKEMQKRTERITDISERFKSDWRSKTAGQR